MKFIKNTITENELILEEIHLHWMIKLNIIICILLSFLIIPIFFAISLYIKLISTEQAITDKRIIVKTGFISRKTEEMILSKIETVEIEQSLFGRIFGFGTIKITGIGNSILLFKDIDNPLEIKKIIETIIYK
jgi:uncharacterized membrane protein YdbT with pleckstrin-like domain